MRMMKSPQATSNNDLSNFERIQKVLAKLGLGSRRAIEELIKNGKIKVNNKQATLGQLIDGNEIIHVNNRRFYFNKKKDFLTRILIYHKNEGEIVSHSDPKHKNTIFQNLPKAKNGKWISIGRLDINTSGLILLTNNGELSNRLMHPRYEIEREYSVRILGEVSEQIFKNIKSGVKLEDGIAKVKLFEHTGGEGANQWYRIILSEGRNREVRRIVESQGLKVSRLMRVRYGQFILPSFLKRGKFYELSESDVNNILKDFNLN
jgi:23S rRNA pseudouridine2605 synthase